MKTIEALAEELGHKLKDKGYKLATAESCTGGGIAYAITHIDGSSQWFDCAFVTYSNEAKQQMLGVQEQLIETEGAVSEAVVLAMANGALAKSHADVSIAITGIAGPTGGTPKKPIGTVWMAFAGKDFKAQALQVTLQGSRARIREKAIMQSLETLLSLI